MNPSPCPVCGRRPKLLFTAFRPEGQRCFLECNSRALRGATLSDRVGEHYVATDRWETEEEAVTQWDELYGNGGHPETD